MDRTTVGANHTEPILLPDHTGACLQLWQSEAAHDAPTSADGPKLIETLFGLVDHTIYQLSLRPPGPGVDRCDHALGRGRSGPVTVGRRADRRLEVIDRKTRAADKELRQLVIERGGTLMDLHGIGQSSAARLLADVGDIRRFRDRDRFASWNGTAPLDASSGDQNRHRLSRAGNRKINWVLHIMAIVQLRNRTPGHVYYDTRKADGKTSMEAIRALKRRLSNVIYVRMLADQRRREWAGPGGQSGTTPDSSATGSNPHTDPSDKPHP